MLFSLAAVTIGAAPQIRIVSRSGDTEPCAIGSETKRLAREPLALFAALEPQKPLFMGSTRVAELRSLGEVDAVAKGGKPTVIMFYAPWCPHCRNTKPVLDTVAERLVNIEFKQIDASRIAEVRGAYGVTAYPTIKYYDSVNLSGIKYQWHGANEDDLRGFLERTALSSGVVALAAPGVQPVGAWAADLAQPSTSNVHPNEAPAMRNASGTMELLMQALEQAKSEELQSTEQALRANAQNTIELHRDQNASVVFYDDDACALLLQEVEPRLMRHWRNETRDMHRSALCRGAALLKTGGLVFDAELECRLDVRKLIFAQTRFVAPFAVPRNIAPVGKEPVLTGRVFLPSFVGAAPRHPILRDFVSRMLDWYEGGQPTLDACDSDFMGSCLLLRAFNAVGEERRQMWEEMHANDIPADEIRRSVGAQDGEGCCCNFLVYDKLTRKIPFWSHAVGANPGTCDVRSSSDGGWSW